VTDAATERATILAVSPHLDDAAFSAGGMLAEWASAGHRVVIATVFTQSVADPAGFALSCQTDKGIAPHVDYMALRRAEDAAACARLGVQAVWLDLPEAPHRGYDSAPELFAGVRTDDADMWQTVRDRLAPLVAEYQPALLLSCQGLGDHADHRVVVRAVRAISEQSGTGAAWWADLPYAMRQPTADAPERGEARAVALSPSDLRAKLDACAAYASQLGYQFARDLPPGDTQSAADAMRDLIGLFARAEGLRFGVDGPAETLHGSTQVLARVDGFGLA
jgi:LmbE family N-acetylglucosaminyl deacetylase